MSKNIVVCCDGTNNDVTSDSTNVLRMFRSLERDRGQLAYYDSGVGTLADPTKVTRWGKLVSRKLDMAMGHSVRENVCQAYRFLSRYYEPGDKIYLFGFSRGAYTVRALAGMIHFLGLVPPELDGLGMLAWSIYADDHETLPVSRRFQAGRRFRKSFSHDHGVKVHFVGVWDTVSAFGYIWNLRTNPFTASNPSVAHVRHAVSIDESRACFRENLFRRKSEDQHESFQQLWFAGCHSDVGGGYPEAESGLAKISLEWMYREAADQGCRLDPKKVAYFLGQASDARKLCKPDPLGPMHQSTQGFWHALEFVPRKQWDHQANPARLRWFWPNVYRRRTLPAGAQLHESVRVRVEADPTYRPSNLPG